VWWPSSLLYQDQGKTTYDVQYISHSLTFLPAFALSYQMVPIETPPKIEKYNSLAYAAYPDVQSLHLVSEIGIPIRSKIFLMMETWFSLYLELLTAVSWALIR
jgi:hypothetical protein